MFFTNPRKKFSKLSEETESLINSISELESNKRHYNIDDINGFLKRTKNLLNHAERIQELEKELEFYKKKFIKKLKKDSDLENLSQKIENDINDAKEKLNSINHTYIVKLEDFMYRGVNLEDYQNTIDKAKKLFPPTAASGKPIKDELNELEETYHHDNEEIFFSKFYNRILKGSYRFMTRKKSRKLIENWLNQKNILVDFWRFVEKSSQICKELKRNKEKLEEYLESINKIKDTLKGSEEGKVILRRLSESQELEEKIRDKLKETKEMLKVKEKENEESRNAKKQFRKLYIKFERIHKKTHDVDYLREHRGLYFIHAIKTYDAHHFYANNDMLEGGTSLVDRLETCLTKRNLLVAASPYHPERHSNKPTPWGPFGIVIAKGIVEGAVSDYSKAFDKITRNNVGYALFGDEGGTCAREIAVRIKKVEAMYINDSENSNIKMDNQEYDKFIELLDKHKYLRFYIINKKGTHEISRNKFLKFFTCEKKDKKIKEFEEEVKKYLDKNINKWLNNEFSRKKCRELNVSKKNPYPWFLTIDYDRIKTLKENLEKLSDKKHLNLKNDKIFEFIDSLKSKGSDKFGKNIINSKKVRKNYPPDIMLDRIKEIIRLEKMCEKYL